MVKCFSWNYPESETDDDQTENDKQKVIRSLLSGYFENQKADAQDLQERRDMVQQNVNRTKKTADYFLMRAISGSTKKITRRVPSTS